MSINLKRKFMILTAVAVTIALGNSYVSEWAGRTLEDLSLRQQSATKVIQRHMDADMQHDGIRGNVYSSLYATKVGDLELLKYSREEIKTMSGEFMKNTHENLAENIPDNIKQQLRIIEQSAVNYTTTAAKISSEESSESASPLLLEFNKTFDTLETDQAKGSQLILAWADNLKNEWFDFNTMSSNIKLALSLTNLFLALMVPFYVMRGILRPQAQMMSAMQRIADGDTTVEIPHTERQDEMGDMARTVQIFKDNAQRVLGLAEEQKRQQTEAAAQRRSDMQMLANTFEANVKNVVDMVASAATEMDATAQSVASIVDNNKEKLNVLSNQIEGTTQNVQTVASATAELSSAVNEINKQVARATAITASAVTEAQKADGTVQGLTDAAGRIGEVIELINSIAAQINLLALNATIEAARAGDAGKGFAVVASEVKSLASQTTKATEQIGQYIASIQSATAETVSVIKNIGGTINEINTISTAIAAAVEEQGVTTQDIAHNVQQAAQSTESVSRNAMDVSESSKETGESANQLMAATSELSRQSETLRHEVDKFLSEVRAG